MWRRPRRSLARDARQDRFAAGRIGRPRLRVRPSRDATTPRRSVPMSGLRPSSQPDQYAPVSWKSPEHTEAYWSGWLDGRYGDPKKFTHNRRLAKWDGAADRLDYYRGHRAGYEARLKKVTLVKAS